MTETSPNYHRVAPRGGAATATAVATEEDGQNGALRAQPHTQARARATVSAAGQKWSQARDARRVALRARNGDQAAATQGREDGLWTAHLPSMAELWQRVQTGPVRIDRGEDGQPVETPVDWPDLQRRAWQVYMLAAVLVAGPLMALLWAIERPGRAVGLLVLATVLWGLVTVGTAQPTESTSAPAPAVTSGGDR